MKNRDVANDRICENVPKIESVEIALVHCNLVKNDCQHASKVWLTFVPNKQVGQLINSFTIRNTINTEFSFVEVCFTDHVSNALKIEDNINLTIIIGQPL